MLGRRFYAKTPLGVYCLYCNKRAEHPEQQTPGERGTLLCQLYRGKPLDRVWFLAVPSKTGSSRHIILASRPLKGYICVIAVIQYGSYSSKQSHMRDIGRYLTGYRSRADNFQDQKILIAWFSVSINFTSSVHSCFLTWV